MQRLTSDVILSETFAWLCRQRHDWPDAAYVWDRRRRWPKDKPRLQQELRSAHLYHLVAVARTPGRRDQRWISGPRTMH